MERSTLSLTPGIRLHIIPAARFKTVTLWVSLHRYGEQHALPMQLLGVLLRRGSERFAAPGALDERLQELYAATLDMTAARRGDWQSLVLALNVPNPRYLSSGSEVLDEALAIAADVLRHPATPAEGLVAEAGRQLAARKQAEIGSPRTRGLVWCRAAMGEPPLAPGSWLAELSKWTGPALQAYWRDCLETAPVDVYAVGDVDVSMVSAMVKKHFAWPDDRPVPRAEAPGPEALGAPAGPTQELTELLPGPLAYLTMGFRTRTTPAAPAYPAMLAALAFFGPYYRSRLMGELRERQRIAYSIQLQPDFMRGLAYLSVGLQADQFRQAMATVIAELDRLKAGAFTPDELAAAVGTLVQDIATMGDNPLRLIDHWLTTDLAGRPFSPAELVGRLHDLTPAEVAAAAGQISLEAVHFGQNKETTR